MRPPALLFLVTSAGCSVSSFAPKAALRDLAIEAELLEGQAHGSSSLDHSDWGRVLEAAVDPTTGLVDYDAVPQAELSDYLDTLARTPLRRLDATEQEALLINAYNAFTVQLILEQSPRPDSIKDLSDPWGTRRWVLGGHTLSLDDIEHGLLRPLFRDPRLHFALNCASVGCPPLQNTPYIGIFVNGQLDRAVRSALQRDGWLQVDADSVRTTKLLNWYGPDFTAEGWAPRADSRAAWLARFGPPEVAEAVDRGAKLEFLPYDWSLNEAP